MADRQEFSVWEILTDGTHWPVERFVDAKRAVSMAHVLADSARGRPDQVARIIITDGGGHTVFEWKRGERVTIQ